MLSTSQKGAIAEASITAAAIELGIPVIRPLVDGCRYDLVFDLDTGLTRVQCKTAVLHGDVLSVPWRSARRSASGFVKRPYTAGEIDAVAAYSSELRQCFFLPIECFDSRTYVQLRLAPTRNNQMRGVNWAEQFRFEARLSPAGP